MPIILLLPRAPAFTVEPNVDSFETKLLFAEINLGSATLQNFPVGDGMSSAIMANGKASISIRSIAAIVEDNEREQHTGNLADALNATAFHPYPLWAALLMTPVAFDLRDPLCR